VNPKGETREKGQNGDEIYHESQQDQQKKKMGRPRKFDEAFRQSVLERTKTRKDVSALVPEL
jgi:hypothetical protein